MLDKFVRKLGFNSGVREKSYKAEFLTAIECTKKFSLEVPRVDIVERKLITSELAQCLPEFLIDRIGDITPEMIVTQCFYFHGLARRYLEELFESPIYFTIGHVETASENYFYHTKKDLKKLLKLGVKSPEINLHAWLTLPSMEIIDLTLPGSIDYVRHKKPLTTFGIIANHPDNFSDGLKYHPTLVGEDFLIKIGAIQEVFFIPDRIYR